MSSSNSLNYKVQLPKNPTKNQPAIFMLHGYGSNANDLFSFAPYLPDNYAIFSLEAPIPLPQMGYAWYSIRFDAPQDQWTDLPEANKSVALIFENVNMMIKKYDLNQKDITLLGFSQGAILSWSLAFNHPNHFRRIIALSGFVIENLIKTKEVTFSAFASHGKEDPVIPYQWAEETIAPLAAKYDHIEFYTYPSGHTVSQENFVALLDWLNKTAKN